MLGIFANDMQVMVPFHRDVLGFDTDWDGQGPHAEFRHEGVRFAMFERAQLPHLLGQTPGYPQVLNGTFEIAIDLPTSADADREFARVVKAGAIPISEGRDEPWGQHASLIADPEGNLIEIGSWNKV